MSHLSQMCNSSPTHLALAPILAWLAQQQLLPQGVADDSRQVRPGDIFLAYPGGVADGRRFIGDAIRRGACAVIWQPSADFVWSSEWPAVPNLPCPDLRPVAGLLADEIAGHPSQHLALIAITGTNGKTTTSQWLSTVFPGKCASIGTLGAGFPGALQDTGFTTPEATTLIRYLQQFRADGAVACALEASSIGIEESRLNGSVVDTAIFTNLTRDHLDYHGTMAAYAEAKLRLFRWPQLRLAIVNIDDAFGATILAETVASKVLAYTISDAATNSTLPANFQGEVVAATNLRLTATGQAFTLVLPSGLQGGQNTQEITTSLVGRYNVANLLVVAAVLFDQGLSSAEIATRLMQLTPPAGRMECHGGVDAPLVAVDYSHTPDALANALAALRELATVRGGKLWCVFGCGGDRDRGKRPLMGEVASQLADQVIITTDNPRSEDPISIIQAIQTGAPTASVVPDRHQAIQQAILGAAACDVILLAGKGHEPYQEIAGVRYPFSDNDQARAALTVRAAKE